MKLNIGCGPFRQEGWTNTDLVHIPGTIDPDIVVTADNPFPFPDASADRIYLGHVLEHVPWTDVPAFLAEVRRVLTPDGRVCVVGPDTLEAVRLWRDGSESWAKVAAIIEGTGPYLEACGEWAPLRWEADRHHWNCHQDRVVEALTACGWDASIIERLPDGRLDRDRLLADGWPLVDDSPCQFSVEATP